MATYSCPCDGVNWDSPPVNGRKCVKCRREYHIWSDGTGEWIEHAAVREIRRLYRDGQRHFSSVHSQLSRLEGMIKDLRKHTPAWRRAKKLKAKRRKEREGRS